MAKKKNMTPAQKAAARKNPDAPKRDKSQKAKASQDASPLGGIGVTILLLVVIISVAGAFLYLNNFFGMLD